MNTVVLNEREYAEERIRNKDIIDGEIFTLQLLARYFYHEKKFRNKKIIECLTEYFSNAYIGYRKNKFYWDDKISSIAAKAGKRQLISIDCIWITAPELEKIKSLENKAMEQLAFTWLCLSKYFKVKNENSNGWVSMSISNIFKLANVSCNTIKKNLYIGALHDFGILEFAKDDECMNYRVVFADDCGKKILRVEDFRCLGYEYLKYCGENYIRCCDCGILTRGNRNGTKRYCSKCSGVAMKNDREIECIDCGAIVTVNSKDRETCRCPECYSEHRREYLRNAKRKEREMSTAQKKMN